MRIFNHHVPCGCEARKEIMFDSGGIGALEAAVLAAACLALVVTYTRKG